MFRRTVLFAAATVMAVLPAMTPASAASSVIVSGPGSYLSTYTQPVTAATKGGELTYVNADIASHDVIARGYGPGTQPWCTDFPIGRCPVFWSYLIQAGKTTPVLGLENIVPGTVYPFYCGIHPAMSGYLVALPAA